MWLSFAASTTERKCWIEDHVKKHVSLQIFQESRSFFEISTKNSNNLADDGFDQICNHAGYHSIEILAKLLLFILRLPKNSYCLKDYLTAGTNNKDHILVSVEWVFGKVFYLGSYIM